MSFLSKSFGNVLGGGLLKSGLGLLGGSGTGKAEAQRLAELRALSGQMQGNLAASFPLQEKYLKQANAASMQGYGSALNDVNRAEAAGQEQIGAQSAAALKAAQAAAAQRGLGGSSVGTNMGLASARDARRASTDFQLGIARQRSGLQMAQGGAQAAGLGALANFQAYKANSMNQALSPYFNFTANKQFTSQQPDLAGIGGLLGGIGGLLGKK